MGAWRLGPQVAASVARFPWVFELDSSVCEVTNVGLELVAQLMQLTSLDLHQCSKITDTGLEHVAKLTQLVSLDLRGCEKRSRTRGLSTFPNSRSSSA